MKRRVVLLVFAALAVAGGAFYWARSNRARGGFCNVNARPSNCEESSSSGEKIE